VRNDGYDTIFCLFNHITVLGDEREKMKIGILGTRGIPNNYGGFEQFAEHLSVGLVELGHEVVVYNSHSHPYQDSLWYGVEIKHIYDPENLIGTMGQFIYDLLCIKDARKQNFEIILQLGYTSSSIFYGFLPKTATLITNMDGWEWSRSKYSKKVQNFLKYAESLAAKKSNCLVADSLCIQEYLQFKYNIESTYIPYGATSVHEYQEDVLSEFKVKNFQYNMLIARLEPENNIEMILDGVILSSKKMLFLVIGNHQTNYGKYLKKKFANRSIYFVGSVYKLNKLNALRRFSNLYFHGHSVGGTNPSLLEAMASYALICAHNNQFNSSILGGSAFYFSTSVDVAKLIETRVKLEYKSLLVNNSNKIDSIYSWHNIISSYEKLFLKQRDIKLSKIGDKNI